MDYDDDYRPGDDMIPIYAERNVPFGIYVHSVIANGQPERLAIRICILQPCQEVITVALHPDAAMNLAETIGIVVEEYRRRVEGVPLVFGRRIKEKSED